MIDNETQITTTRSARRWGTAAALVAAGLAGGLVLAGTVTANAATSTPSPSATSGTTGGSSSTAPQHPSGDQSTSQRSDEKLLTGTTADKVRAAALATYPGATIQRVETDSDGVYEAHVVTKAGAWVIVAVGKDFTVTGTQTPGLGGPAGHCGDGGPGHGLGTGHDGQRPDPSGTGTSTGTPSVTPSTGSTA